jgi:hypothetical protein
VGLRGRVAKNHAGKANRVATVLGLTMFEYLKSLNREFLNLLEIKEESDAGKPFQPNQICSCRAVDGQRMNEILLEIKKILNESHP